MATTLYSPSFDINSLSEAIDLECKLASGGLPKSLWESYSAMANTRGGEILLGVEEVSPGKFAVHGVENPQKMVQDLWNAVHNTEKISTNLLSHEDVGIVELDKPIIYIKVRQARREERPVHVGQNPMNGTYLRRNEGDYKATAEQVRRMMAERVEDARDARILEHFDIADIDLDTVTAYRNRFSAVRPGHIYVDLSLPEFLQKIGAYGKNRQSGLSGLTVAGLLMFGTSNAIREVLPNYMVDYQERPEARAEKRWVDRLTPDGSWSGNLYDFFRRTYQKLTDGLKIPFRLVEGQRVEDSPQSEALREALVNTIIHADFTGRVSVLVVKRPDMYGFRNPGKMRIPLDLAILGGNSDCRNRKLQVMFQLVGYGDHAGSGIPKIYSNWQSQQWRRPSLYELDDPEQTLMELRMESMFPEEAIDTLRQSLGDRFSDLPELERLILVTAAAEGTTNHARIKELCTDHPVDISKSLTALVRSGLLESDGVRRGMIYFLPGYSKDASEFFAAPAIAAGRTLIDERSQTDSPVDISEPSYGHNLDASGHSEAAPGYSDELSGSDADKSRALEELQAALTAALDGGALQKRMQPERMRALIASVCHGRYVSLRNLAALLGRSEASLRKHYLNPMVEEGTLARLHALPSHPHQAYTSRGKQASLDLDH